jgi:hypothetical protein
LLRALRDAAQDGQKFDSSLQERREALTLVGSPHVRRDVDTLDFAIADRNRMMPMAIVEDFNSELAVDLRQRIAQGLADVEKAMRIDVGVEE